MILDRVSKLQRIFVIINLHTFFGNNYQQLVAGKRLANAIGKLGSEIDIALAEIERHDCFHRLSVAVGTFDIFGKKRCRRQQIALGLVSGYKMV